MPLTLSVEINLFTLYILQICENPMKINAANSKKANSSHFKVRVSIIDDSENTFIIQIPKTIGLPSFLINELTIMPYWSDVKNYMAHVDSKVTTRVASLMGWYIQGTV